MRNSSGSTLTGVLVGSAILSVIILGTVSTIELGISSESRMSASNERRQLELELNEVLKTQNCGIGAQLPIRVTDRNWPAAQIFDLREVSSPYLTVTAGGRFGSSAVDSLALAPYLNKATGARTYVQLGTTTRKASLRISLSKGANQSQLNIPVVLQTNPGGDQITSCLTEEQQDMMAAMCTSFGGTWNPGGSNCALPPPPPPAAVPTDVSSFTSCGVGDTCGVPSRFFFP